MTRSDFARTGKRGADRRCSSALAQGLRREGCCWGKSSREGSCDGARLALHNRPARHRRCTCRAGVNSVWADRSQPFLDASQPAGSIFGCPPKSPGGVADRVPGNAGLSPTGRPAFCVLAVDSLAGCAATHIMPYKDPAKRRAYNKTYAPKHYAANKDAYFARAKEHDGRMQDIRKSIIFEHLKVHHCVDCGEDDAIVLEFDHREHDKKSFAIGAHSTRQISVEKLIAEIAKCDVRCANCHRRKTYRERGLTHRG